jgi:hypothetical protein
MRNITWLIIATLLIACGSCKPGERSGTPGTTTEMPVRSSFEDDLRFLMSKDSVRVLRSGNARVIVSPKYQAKVFTSTADGPDGMSFGWINYKAFDGPADPHMNAYGGENRFWLGPEGNRFSLFFAPGDEMTFDNWVTPAAIDTEAWNVENENDKSVTLSKAISVTNYHGTQLSIRASRSVTILEASEIPSRLNITIPENIRSVGYTTTNEIVNAGDRAWTRETGAPCIWILDMFNPSPATAIILPFNEHASGTIVTSDYFGQVPPARLRMMEHLVLFKADGKSRGKIGIPPGRARPLAGSFDADNNILTVVTFDADPDGVYLNQEWSTKKDAFSGDAVNAYNDGPLEDGSQMGPFYELESVSPAAFLRPGENLVHRHNVFHFTGDRDALLHLLDGLFGSAQEILDWLKDEQ